MPKKRTFAANFPVKTMDRDIPTLTYYDMGPQVVAFSTTRQGGDSTTTLPAGESSNYATFNINRYCGDSDEHICRNREALCRLLDISDDRLVMPHQTHQTRVTRIDESLLALSAEDRQEALEGYDALMTDLQGVCIGVSTADCIPLLLHDPRRHVVCAIHAGWRGTVARIAQKAVSAMTATYGSQPEDIVAQSGPGISLDSFEVGQEVWDAFAAAGFDMQTISRKSDKWHIDLQECNRQQLVTAGLRPQSITLSGICTFKQCDTFFSARRLGINSGRIFTGILYRKGTARFSSGLV